MIYLEMMAAKRIVSALKIHGLEFWELCNGSIILSGAKIRENAPIANRHIHELVPENKVSCGCNKTKWSHHYPNRKDQILPGDILYFTTLRKQLNELPEIMGKTSFENRISLLWVEVEFFANSDIYPIINVKVVERPRACRDVSRKPLMLLCFLEMGAIPNC